MPIYEYNCSSCSHAFELIVAVGAAEPACPDCGGSTEKKISLSSFHLKGSGWYSDAYSGADNKRKSTKDSSDTSSNADDSSASSKSTDSGSGSSDSGSPSKGDKSSSKGKSSESKKAT